MHSFFNPPESLQKTRQKTVKKSARIANFIKKFKNTRIFLQINLPIGRLAALLRLEARLGQSVVRVEEGAVGVEFCVVVADGGILVVVGA